MTNPSIWEPGSAGSAIAAARLSKMQAFTANEGQSSFTVTAFSFVPNVGAIELWVNGVYIRNFTEAAGGVVSLGGARVCRAGDSVVVRGITDEYFDLNGTLAATYAARDTAVTAASTATTQANEASVSAAAALASQNSAAAAYDSFDDRYLGAKATAPALDNDGNTLLTGALYWNTAQAKMYVWSGTAWLTSDTLSATIAGDLTFTSTGQRIRGDFSNATVANRLMFQTSTVNGQTSVGVLPDGTNTITNLNLFGGSDPANASIGQLVNTGTEVRLSTTVIGAGTYLPMTFWTGGVERMRIDTNGNVGIGTNSPLSAAGYTTVTTYNATNGALFRALSPDYSSDVRIQAINGIGLAGTFSNVPLLLCTNTVERMRINSEGAIGLSGANYGTSGQALVSNGSGAAPSWQTISSGLPAASTAEAQALISNVVAISPLQLKEAFQGTNQSLAASGYQKLPGGLIIQWGRVNAGTVSGGPYAIGSPKNIAVTFPIAFPNTCLNTSCTAHSSSDGVNSNSGRGSGTLRTFSSSGATYSVDPHMDGYSANFFIHWLAIGY